MEELKQSRMVTYNVYHKGILVPKEELEVELCIMETDDKGIPDISKQHRVSIDEYFCRVEWMGHQYMKLKAKPDVE